MAFTLFRYIGDLCHLASILTLLYKIHTRKTAAGISLRTRVLYLFVFLARYGDLFLYYVSFYNTFMKILYLSTTAYIIYLMTIEPTYKTTWYHDLDNFSILPLLITSALLSLLCTSNYSLFEIFWTFSLILESVAILPQIDHLTKIPAFPALPLGHLVALGLYRFFYVLSWVIFLFTEGRWEFTIFFFGMIQTVIWADFFVVWYYRKRIKLPPNTVGHDERSAEEGNVSGQGVDEGDMSRSLVLTHIFRGMRAFEKYFRVGRKTPGLSVSAYPDDSHLRPGQGSAYTDGATVAQMPATEAAAENSTEDDVLAPQQRVSSMGSPSRESEQGATLAAATADALEGGDGFNVDSDDDLPPPIDGR